MYRNEKLLVGKNGDKEVYLLPKMANRHGLITGASGSGKTITLKVLSESFSDARVPVFLVDVKGDLAGMPFQVIQQHFMMYMEKMAIQFVQLLKVLVQDYFLECLI